MNKYDVIIIGAGPAGLTSAIYAGRRVLKTLVLTMNLGGQMNLTEHIENYPGVDLTGGADLSLKMMEQAKKFGAEVMLNQEVLAIEKKEDDFLVKTTSGEYESQTVILAFGKAPRKLEVEGADKYLGKGLSYCATCDGPLFKNKIIAVVGGGNSALGGALYLSELAEKVYLIHRSETFRGDEILVNKIKNKSNIELVLNSEVSALEGEEVLEKIKIKDSVSGSDPSSHEASKDRTIDIDGVFIEIGYEVKADFVKSLVKVDELSQIITDSEGKTSVEGIFAAGDLIQSPYKQIAISVGQGATAALSAYDYIQKKQGKTTVRVDWGQK
ncbi:MAG: thioredoxin-disulfide reductase [Patescibacteria group bacterium]|nr:thioredoxin-disulfide reductase [Patescibacteria group bacterium]